MKHPVSALKKSLYCVALTAAALGMSMPTQAVTPEEISQRGTAKIGVLSGVPIYGTVDAKGNPAGYDIDVAQVLAKDLGVKAELVPLTPPARIPALQSQKIDFLVATLAQTPERAKVVLFTAPYSAFQMVIFSGKDAGYKTMDDMKGKSIGVNRGSPQETALVKAAIPDLKIVRYEDDATVVQALISKQIDAAAIPGEVAKAVAKQPNGAGLGIQFTFFHQPNRMAVRPGDTEMRDWLNKAIQKMTTSGELNAISEKWTGNSLPDLSHD